MPKYLRAPSLAAPEPAPQDSRNAYLELIGRMQQQGRLDVAGKILFIRIFSFAVCYAALFVLTKDILLTTAAATALAAVLAVVLNRSVWSAFREEKPAGKVRQLLRACAPLCLSMLLNMYLVPIYGKAQYVEGVSGNNIYLNHKLIEQKQLNLNEVLTRCEEFLEAGLAQHVAVGAKDGVEGEPSSRDDNKSEPEVAIIYKE